MNCLKASLLKAPMEDSRGATFPTFIEMGEWGKRGAHRDSLIFFLFFLRPLFIESWRCVEFDTSAELSPRHIFPLQASISLRDNCSWRVSTTLVIHPISTTTSWGVHERSLSRTAKSEKVESSHICCGWVFSMLHGGDLRVCRASERVDWSKERSDVVRLLHSD